MGVEEFFDLMPQAVTVAPWTGQDGYGKPTFGAAVSYTARVVGKVRRIVNAVGQEVVSTKTVYLGAAAAVGPKDQVTLPAGESPLTPPIISVGRYPDEGGQHHTVLYLA